VLRDVKVALSLFRVCVCVCVRARASGLSQARFSRALKFLKKEEEFNSKKRCSHTQKAKASFRNAGARVSSFRG
jgi:hypothetical protein